MALESATHASSPSRTAEVMALFRALETLRPAGKRLFADPLAKDFLRPWARAMIVLARLPLARRLIERVVDRQWPGARTSAIARTKLIDDAVRGAIDDGMTQLVVLGAGFDSRSYRLPQIGRVRVFEVDRPAIQERKIQTITRRFGWPATHVAHIPIDFQTQTVDLALLANGFDSQVPSFIVWEGVTNYLSEHTVDFTVRGLSNVAAAGSRMLFTYVHRGLLDGSVEFAGGLRVLERVRKAGEPWTFGFEPRELPAYLAERGWTLIEDVSADEYRSRYFGAAARSMSGYAFYRAVVARLNKRL
jgi:methyltransferase (TIGR00027 family)